MSNKNFACEVPAMLLAKPKESFFSAYFDGACEPFNPGGALGIGACIIYNGSKVYEYSQYIPMHPNNSNNVAEYLAFETLLDYFTKQCQTNVAIKFYGDSMLVVNQMKFLWRIKKGMYAEHAIRCREKLMRLTCYSIDWIPREQNKKADELSKRELIKNAVEFRIQPMKK